jgi:hypothetical protein
MSGFSGGNGFPEGCCQMTIRSVRDQNAEFDRYDGSEFDLDNPVNSESAQAISAVMLSSECAHDWVKLDQELQTLTSEGKTIWRCRGCAKITNTYDWQNP